MLKYEDFEDRVKDYTHSDSDEGKGSMIAGFLIGAGVGLLAGVLLAPRSGKETIEQVGARTQDWRHQFGGIFDKVTSMINDYVDQGRQAAEQGAERIRDAANKA